jgi:hypothetical protein
MTRVPIAYLTIVCHTIKRTTKRSRKLDVEVTYKADETTLSGLLLPSRKHYQNVETELV